MSDLALVSVDSLPFPREEFFDCSAIGCDVNAMRLNANCARWVRLNCFACRHQLACDPREGWFLELNSREDIARRRQEAREENAPRVGAGWEALRKMQKKAA